MRRALISAAGTLGLVAASLVGVVAAGGSASASCDPPGTVYYRTKALGKRYRPTAMHSDWANGGQTVTVTKGKTVKSGVRTFKKHTHNIDVGAEWGPIKAAYNYKYETSKEVSTSKSYTLTQSYSVKVPRAKTAREMRWQRKMRIRVIKERTKAPCDIVVVGRAVVEAPLAGRTFVWDFQDDDTGLPGCRVKGYPSYGGC